MGLRARISDWLDERAGLGALARFARDQALKPVPRRLSWAYTLGTLALFYFGLQFITGFLLLIRYAPHEETAYATVQAIEHRAHLGWLVRQLHAWGASFVIIVLHLHILKVLWYGSYKRPREVTWFVGVLLLAVAFGFCFTGYILPWTQVAKWATAVATDGIGKVPLVGESLNELVRGGREVSGETLGRFFAVHVLLMPIALGVLALAHLVLVRWKGITPKVPVTEEARLGYEETLAVVGGEPFFPRQVYRELLVMVLGFAALVTACVFSPVELGEPASDITPSSIKPEWYFLPPYQLVKYFDDELLNRIPLISSLGLDPEFASLLLMAFGGLAFLFLPLLDRGRNRRITRRPLFSLIALIALASLLALGVLGYLSNRSIYSSLLDKTFTFPAKAFPVKVEEGNTIEKPAPASNAEGGKDARTGAGPVEELIAGPPSAPIPDRRPDGLPWGGTCGPCHESQLEDWQKSVHAATDPPVECVQCHRGLDTIEDEELAHAGVLVDDDGDWRKPVLKEVVDLCGKCHAGVMSQFSPDHLGIERARSCFHCHSNHEIVAAGLETFKARRAYTDADDPRTRPFREIEALAARWEEERRGAIAGIEERLGELRAAHFPLDLFSSDLRNAELLRHPIAEAAHSLDPAKVQKAIGEARAALERAAGAIEAETAARAARWQFAVGVWVVTLVCALLLGIQLRRMPR